MTDAAWRYLEESWAGDVYPDGDLAGLVAGLWPNPDRAAADLAAGWVAVKAAEEDDADRAGLEAEGGGRDVGGLMACLPVMRQVLAAGLLSVGPPAVAFLARQFAESADPVERAGVALLLGEFGGEAAGAAPLLAAEVSDPRRPAERHALRCAAAYALGKIDAATPEVVGSLAGVAGDPAEPQPLRAYCVEALMDLGPAAAAAVPVLERVLRDDGEDADLRDFAWAALKSVGAASREHPCGGTVAEHMRSLYRSG